ncbi:MAG: NPCBM/NEW2 domain-containing protein, partial [Victivallales bacterium]|nr:NPCBM/NEW2 domain-containing protein [Victivallales bacterium]
EGPINDVLNAPFMLVVGTSSPDPEMNVAWMQEAKTFMSEWKRRNGAPCLMVPDTKCSIEDMQNRNLILFGGSRDNCVSDLLSKSLPTSDVMANLPLRNQDPEADGVDALNAPDLGYMMLYPNAEYAPDRLVVVVSANSPESAYQLWGRFGNWFNWGVFDSKKYFDYAVFDSRSVSPETMLLLGWFGTDWRVESGSYFIGDEKLRAAVAPQGYPPFKSIPEDISTLSLAEVMPSKIDQMRGALGYSRGFFGEVLLKPVKQESGEKAETADGNDGGEKAETAAASAEEEKLVPTVGLGMRAPCTLEYEINGLFTNFTASVRLLNSPETNMCMIREKGEKIRFAVYGDGIKLGEKTVDWRHTDDELSVNVSNVKTLKLEAVPSGGPSWLHSGCAWLEPTLKK